MENKSKLNTVLSVIIIILLIVGLGYILLNKTEKIEVNNPLQENKNEVSATENNLSLNTHNSLKANYNVKYPSDWILVDSSESENSSNFQIKNSLDAILPGANSEMRSIDSLITIQVANYEINPLVHKTIDDVLKDPKFGVSKTNRINNVSQMSIGGKNLRVEKMSSTRGEGYGFLYNGKVYRIDFSSGSENQYNLDRKIFTDFVSSFVLN